VLLVWYFCEKKERMQASVVDVKKEETRVVFVRRREETGEY
jgi:hypothetical protein